MIKGIFQQDLLENTYGFSCIENYLIYGMREQGYEYVPLFFNSYISLTDIIYEFIQNKAKYAFFYKIPRIHNIALEYGLIEKEYQNRKIINLNRESIWDYLAITVKPKYLLEKYGVSLWREDHYILLRRGEGNDIFYLNDSPRDSGLLQEQELSSLFDGMVLKFSVKKKIDSLMKVKFYEIFLESLKCDYQKSEKEMLENLSDINIVIARDIMGVLRISRKRICEYLYNFLTDKEFTENYLKEIDIAYASLEYMRLRKQSNLAEIGKIYRKIFENDRIFIWNVREMSK